MATKYSDIITIREGKPAYNIADEEGQQWKDFIANKQFNEILKKVIKSVRNTDVDAHRSFWIQGTYGTGKSHASAVIKHLLCDDVEAIKDFVDTEYGESQYQLLRNDIYALREKKRLFPITLYGQNLISHKEDLSLQLQRSISDALQKAGISITVKTDFDNYVEHIEKQPDIWELLIKNSPQLASIAPTLQILKNKLISKDSSTFEKVVDAQRETGIDIRLNINKLSDWFFEVQDELASQKSTYGYDGLLVIWDEFTDIAASSIGPSLLVALQEIDEKVMNSKNNSYFLYISHPSALNGLDNQEREKTKGRYHFMPYQMETVSAFKIMSRKFCRADGATDQDRQSIIDKFYNTNEALLEVFTPDDSTNQAETKKDLQLLFPIHPSTVNLATYYAREVGSSSRSVFEFIGNNQQVRDFIDSESHFNNGDTITADYLWDYVLPIFNDDVIKYGVVTERFNARHLQVENKGYEYSAVFKGILLLNALNNIANSDTVTPTGDNIANLFQGTSIAPHLNDILEYFDEQSIIQRLPGDFNGLYSIQFSALPPKDIEEAKQELKQTQFKRIEQVLNFDEQQVRNIIEKTWLSNVSRQFQYKIFSLHDNEYLLQNQIENSYKQVKTYELFIAMLFGKNANEVNSLKEIAERTSSDSRFSNIVFILFDEPFTDKNYERFIEYMANSKCAAKYNQSEQQKTYRDNAFSLVKDWLNAIRRANFSYYLRGSKEVSSTQKITSTINESISPKIFSNGPESIQLLRRVPSTFWKKQLSKQIVDNVISFNSKQEIIDHCTGPCQPFRNILQDTVDDNLEFVSDIDINHPLYLINNFIDNKFKHTNKSESFNMGEKLKELSMPPYGLYQSFAALGMVAFAMRKYVKQIYDLNGKPRDTQNVVEDIVEMFKAWENDKESNKLKFRFETKESRNVCEKLIKLFNLDKLSEYSDISSLTDARKAINYGYLKQKGFPLWALKDSNANISDGMKELIDNILRILATDNTRDPNLLNNTLAGIQTWNFDLKNLLNQPDAFQKGFLNFMLSINGLNFKESEYDEAFNYLEHNLQAARGLWSEDEVKQGLNSWRTHKSQEEAVNATIALIQKTDNIDECQKYLAHSDNRVVEAVKRRIRDLQIIQPQHDFVIQPQTRPETQQFAQKRSTAINKVQSISDMAKARDILKQICENDAVSEIIIDLINNYDA